MNFDMLSNAKTLKHTYHDCKSNSLKNSSRALLKILSDQSWQGTAYLHDSLPAQPLTHWQRGEPLD